MSRARNGGGEPLSSSTRAFMEPRFGFDFANVRVHTGPAASEAATQVQARAFTLGRDIVFGEHQYSPETKEGRRLLAHELAHVVQGQNELRREPDPAELERVRKLEEEYQAAVREGRWQIAAEKLNAFNREDILARLQSLKRGQIGAIHRGAIDNPRVGPDAQVAALTRPAYLDLNFENEIKKSSWGEAALVLNGFNDFDIFERVKKLGPAEREKLRQGARLSMPGGSERITKAIAMAESREKDASKPTGDVARHGDLVPAKSDPKTDERYIQNIVKSVGIPIWGGHFYLKRSAAPGWNDSIVLARNQFSLGADPLAATAIEITSVYKDRASADAAMIAYGPGAYTYYVGPGGYIYPTIISATTAPALCFAAEQMIEQERKDAQAAANLAVALALWHAGARNPIKTGGAPAARTLIRPVNGKINIGGGLETGAELATNVNPIKAGSGGPTTGIPNHIRAGFEDIAEIFEAGSAKLIYSNRLRYVDVNWPAAAGAAAKVIEKGGKLSLNVWANAKEAEIVVNAFKAAGFKGVRAVGEGTGTIIMGAM